MKTDNPYVSIVAGFVLIASIVGLLLLGLGAVSVASRRLEESTAEIEREEAKVLAEKCKLVSNSVRADPFITERPLSLHICNDQGVSTYFVTRKPFP